MSTMKAAIYRSFNGTIRIETVKKPQVPSDGVVLQVMATGVCRSDWHGWKGHDGDIIQHGLPFCPGHEVSGIVVKVGERVSNFTIGDHVVVPFILSCGDCRHCKEERPTVCLHQQQPGFTIWGSFAEYVKIPRADRNLRKIPPHVSFVQAAALGCRFTTAYRAVLQQGRLKEGNTIAIFGCGGLGMSCIMIAATKQDCTIIAVDISNEALEKACQLGATHAVLIKSTDKPESIRDRVCPLTRNNEGADITVDAAGFASTSESAVWCARPSGRMVQVGLPIGGRPPQIPMALVAGKELELFGSHGFAADDLPDLLQMVATKKIDPARLVEKQVTLEEGCQVIQAMDHGSPLGMVMITRFDASSTTSSHL
jgi:alcohol dehydrogenase